MQQVLGIGIQDFETVRMTNNFYIDKTYFIKEWWETNNLATLITRPRRFGKTLNMSMLNCFFSNQYENRGDLFEGLSIWEDEKYRQIQGTYPVIYMTFAGVKPNNYENFLFSIKETLADLYLQHQYLLKSEALNESQKESFTAVRNGETENPNQFKLALKRLCMYLSIHFGKKAVVILDEYDTPMQEAYLHGYWNEAVQFIREMFGNTFKENPYLERAMLTGITRVSKESIFSDLNNLEVITATSNQFETAFGFTEQEVFHVLEQYGLADKKQDVKAWYDGFKFGNTNDIYNPWSILNYLKKHKLDAYWANTSSNSLVSKLIREGSPDLKGQMELLLNGGELEALLDEQIVFNQLDTNETAVWSLLAAAGYLKITHLKWTGRRNIYYLKITNLETEIMFENLINGWFQAGSVYNVFVKAFLQGNLKEMNAYMNQLALYCFSSFDTGNHPSKTAQPERFYHGFVLRLLVELRGRYQVKSNRESGFGKYDVMLIPQNHTDPAIIIEFKVMEPDEEGSLKDTVQNALEQIREKNYDAELIDSGLKPERIRHYGFAFKGKEILIGK